MLRPEPVDFLILGAGWTSTFLLPLLKTHHIPHAATTTTGRDHTIPFIFSPTSSDRTPYTLLPSAKTILITFPLKGPDQSAHLLSLYRSYHGPHNNWIQLGSTGIFAAEHWNVHISPYKTDDPRAIAEDQLRALDGCVLNLAGLYGGTRDPKNWVTRVATTKSQVREKKALHLIHGEDVARGILAVHLQAAFPRGKRWLLTDLHVYDWWDLIQSWGPEVEERERAKVNAKAHEENGNGEHKEARLEAELAYEKWVGELMLEEGVRALPRGAEGLGRVLDSRAFWEAVGIWPGEGRVR